MTVCFVSADFDTYSSHSIMSEMYMDIIKLRGQVGETKREDKKNSGSCQHADDCF